MERGATDMPNHILIVEDEAQVLIMAESYLAEHGHETHSASSIAEAIAILEADKPIDILFTDLGLMHDGPQAGLELAKQGDVVLGQAGDFAAIHVAPASAGPPA